MRKKSWRIGLWRERMMDVLAVARDGTHTRFSFPYSCASIWKTSELAERHANRNLTTLARNLFASYCTWWFDYNDLEAMPRRMRILQMRLRALANITSAKLVCSGLYMNPSTPTFSPSFSGNYTHIRSPPSYSIIVLTIRRLARYLWCPKRIIYRSRYS